MKGTLSAVFAHADAAIALGLLALGLVEALFLVEGAPLWPQAPLTFVWTLPLIWRRRFPVPVLAVVIVMGPTLSLANEQGGVISFVLAAMFAAYTVGRELDPPATWWGPALTVGFGWVVFGATDGVLSDFVFVAVLYGGAWAVGYAIRRRELAMIELSAEADDLRRGQAEREWRAIEQERARIARELHDIVSHSISVITVQTQAVRRRLGPEHSREVDDLRAIETVARQAMAEMRRMLGILRADGAGADLQPQPGLSQLDRLVESMSEAGLAIELRVEGEPVALSPGVDLAAYRVIQEALTNVLKHARAATALVSVTYTDRLLEVRVEDDGPGVSGDQDGGQGLIGMRERVLLYGGEFSSGGREDGGFCVRARLPIKEEAMSG